MHVSQDVPKFGGGIAAASPEPQVNAAPSTDMSQPLLPELPSPPEPVTPPLSLPELPPLLPLLPEFPEEEEIEPELLDEAEPSETDASPS